MRSSPVVVILSPDSDDAALSVGGLIMRMRPKYRGIIYNIFTVSSYTHSSRINRTIFATSVRFIEESVACAIMRVKVRFLWFREALLRSAGDDLETSLYVKITRLLKKDQPDIILSPLGVGGHPDHMLVFKISKNMDVNKYSKTGKIKAPIAFYEDVPYSDREGVKERLEEVCRNSYYPCRMTVDITNEISIKMKVIMVYRSQFTERDWERIKKRLGENSIGFDNCRFQETPWFLRAAK